MRCAALPVVVLSIGILTALSNWAQGAVDHSPQEYLHIGDYGEAARTARARVAEAPEDAGAWLVLGHALSELGRIEEASEAYRQVARPGTGASLEALVAGARLALRYGDREAARSVLRRVLTEHRESTRERTSEELTALADAAAALAHDQPQLYAEALSLYEQAISVDQGNVSAHIALADLLLDRYNNEEAQALYREAIKIDGHSAPAWCGLARSDHFDGSSRALDAAQRCLELQPSRVEGHLLLSRMHVELEEYDAAEAEIEAALAVNAHSPEALTLSAAIAYLRDDRERFDAAVGAVRENTRHYPELFVTLAEIAAQNRRYGDAVWFAQVAVEVDESAWRAHALLGTNRLRVGQVAQGRRSLATAFRGDPFNVWAKNTLDLLDRVETYKTVESRRFVLVAPATEADILAPYLLPLAEQAYERFAAQYGYWPRTPIRIEIYPRQDDFSVRTIGLVGFDVLGVSFGPTIALNSPSSSAFNAFNWASTLWHEIAHTFHLGLTGSRVPRWFSEGLAVYEERRARPGWGADVTPGFLQALHQQRLMPVSRLNESFLRPRYPEQMQHGYFQTSLLMEHIETEHGYAAIVKMLEGYRDGLGTAELSMSVLGLEAEALDATFTTYLQHRYASALAALFGPGNRQSSPTAATEGSADQKLAATRSTEGPFFTLLRSGREALEAGEIQDAERDLLKAQTLFPEHAGPGSTYRLLATLYEGRGDAAPAIEQLMKAVEIDADDIDAHRQLAALYLEVENRSAAVEIFERALQIQPFDPTLHEQLAELFELSEDWSSAARCRAAVLALEPADPAQAGYTLARVLSLAGDPEAARIQVLRVLEHAPLYDQALELLLDVRAQLDAALDSNERQGDATKGPAG